MGGIGIPGGATSPKASARQSSTRTEFDARANNRSMSGERCKGGDPRATKRM
jgi:hypothetical protein